MSNQEVFDAYAAKIADQNVQIKNAVAVLVSEVANLRAAAGNAEVPLDTTSMDAAVSALTAAVDEVESIPTPVAEPAEVVEEATSPAADEAPAAE